MMLLFLVLCQAPVSPPARQEIKVDYVETVNLVRLSIKARHEGRPYKVSADDLRILENGKPVAVNKFTEIETPLTMHFLLDLSTSNEKYIFRAKKAARDLINKMKKQDLAKISFFSRTYQELTPYTDDRKLLLKKLGFLAPVGTTALYDGLSSALDQLSQESGVRVLILLSDGHDLSSYIAEKELTAKVRNHNIPIIFVPLGKITSNELLAQQVHYMEELTEISGGSTLDTSGGVGRALIQHIREERRRYVVTFEPPHADETEMWRSLRVALASCPDCQLSYRRAYQLNN